MFSFLLVSCNKLSQPKDAIPSHETFTINSKLIGENRTINVWFPADYASGKDSLTVLYMPDGGVEEDFPHIANTLSELINSKKIKPVILVGIENTQRRRDLSGPTEVETDKEIAPEIGGSEKFRDFVKEELFPEIEKRYRTTLERGIIGESLAGLFIVETFLEQPEMFDFYIAIDPSLWWNDHHLVKISKEKLAKFPSDEKRFWFAGSDAEDIYKFTRELENLLKSDAPQNLKWQYSDEPNEQHQTIYRATKVKALEWSIPD